MTSAGLLIIHETNITTEGGDGSLLACKSLVIYLRFHQNENLLKFSRRRRLDDVLTTSHMRRTLARENFTSARRRRAISLSMLKVPIILLLKILDSIALISVFLIALVLLRRPEYVEKSMSLKINS